MLGRDPASKLGYMAAIEIYYISRMSQETKSDPGKHPDRTGNKMVSPENKILLY